ncbi:lytic murein transglycosylase [Jatrophihabitans fulvus]
MAARRRASRHSAPGRATGRQGAGALVGASQLSAMRDHRDEQLPVRTTRTTTRTAARTATSATSTSRRRRAPRSRHGSGGSEVVGPVTLAGLAAITIVGALVWLLLPSGKPDDGGGSPAAALVAVPTSAAASSTAAAGQPDVARPSAIGVADASTKATPKAAADDDPVPASTLAAGDIPTTALAAYQYAAARQDGLEPGCHITWPLLGAIGRVESNHGRAFGAVLHQDGTSSPPIRGIPLNGNGTAEIRDTDHGRLDGDRVYDRAVGPMQFIPSTWASWGVDADRDGRKDPNDIDDAAAAAAAYLCAAGRDLSTYRGTVQAILSYNHSTEYVHDVMAIQRIYAAGVVAVPTAPGTGRNGSPAPLPSLPKPTLPPVDPGKPRGLPPQNGGSGEPVHPKPTPKPKPTRSSGAGSTSPGGSSGGPTSGPVTTDPATSDPGTSGPVSSDPGSGPPTDLPTDPTDVPSTDTPPSPDPTTDAPTDTPSSDAASSDPGSGGEGPQPI